MAHLETRVKGLSEGEIYDYMQGRFPKDNAAKNNDVWGSQGTITPFFLDGLNTLDYGSFRAAKNELFKPFICLYTTFQV